jgi:hypothetical protein
MKREVLSDLIYHKIGFQKKSVEKQFSDSSDSIGYFFLLMTCAIRNCLKIHQFFPKPEDLVLKKAWAGKYVGAQMNFTILYWKNYLCFSRQ